MHSAMEEAKHWMLTRRKFPLRQIYNESWEEKAFAEDSSGLLGGCVWPPRSYSCTFCAREFRSAQALGGHMNVHRRDRARLKQSSIVGDEDIVEDRNPNPNPNPNPNFGPQVSLFNPLKRKLVNDVCYSTTRCLWGEELKLGFKRRFDEGGDEGESNCNKRKKMKSFLFDEDFGDDEVINMSSEIVEELDLELRLGDLPKDN